MGRQPRDTAETASTTMTTTSRCRSEASWWTTTSSSTTPLHGRRVRAARMTTSQQRSIAATRGDRLQRRAKQQVDRVRSGGSVLLATSHHSRSPSKRRWRSRVCKVARETYIRSACPANQHDSSTDRQRARLVLLDSLVKEQLLCAELWEIQIGVEPVVGHGHHRQITSEESSVSEGTLRETTQHTR